MQPPALVEQPTPRPVVVDWVDAVHRFGWQDGLEPERGVSAVRTLGFLMVADDHCVVVALSVAADSHAQTIEIPRGMIREVRYLELPL